MRLMRRPRLELPPLARLREQLEDMFNQPDLPTSGWFSGWTPAVDVIEDKDRLTVKAELPGFRREDIDVSLHENNLTICGERKYEDEKQEGEMFRSERFYGKFQRTVPLPFMVETSDVKATYRDGVLSVTLPKSEKARGKQIEVAVE